MRRKPDYIAFHKQSKNLIDLVKITPLALSSDFPGNGIFIPDDERVIIMQFTGQSDRTGKKVYEDFVLDILIPDDHFWGADLAGKRKRAVIEWNEDHVNFIARFHRENPRHQDYVHFTCDVAIDAEVLGNIHQHPHLKP